MKEIHWLDESTFKTDNFVFNCSMTDYTGSTTPGSVYFLKDRKFIDIYSRLLAKIEPRNILEIGFFEGGTSIFLAEVAQPSRIASLDFRDVPAGLAEAVRVSGLDDIIRYHPKTLQDDRPKLAAIIASEFADRPLDLVIDDCSHEYEATKASFETAFGYLKPGGTYLIEDWGWAHLDGVWQSPDSYFRDRPALTNLIFDLTMLMGTDDTIISHIEILSPLIAAITRGPKLAHGEPLDIESRIRARGRTPARI